MSPAFARPSAVLSAFPMKRYSTMEGRTQRHTHDVLRHTVERLWYPFTQGNRGADLNSYRFREHLAELCTPGSTFTCQVNGMAGGTRVLEDFFTTVLSGFDIVRASVEGSRGMTLGQPADLCNYTGFYVLAHTRPFLGWAPSPNSLRGTQHPSGTLADVNSTVTAAAAIANAGLRLGEAGKAGSTDATVSFGTEAGGPTAGVTPALSTNACTLVVPFTTHVEGLVGDGRLSHLVLRTPVMELLSRRPECPVGVQQCLESRDAMKMFATLRRAGVKPSMITAKTLLSASKQSAAWSSALGVL